MTALKREILIHSSFLLFLFVFSLIVNGNFNLTYITLFFGGIIGMILPDIDHVIYIYLVRPYEFTSQRFFQYIRERKFFDLFSLIYETRTQRKNLIFHSRFFLSIFFIVAFWIKTSSGSIFGQGVALAFLIHLVVDQIIDSFDSGLISGQNEKIYIIIILLLTLVINFI